MVFACVICVCCVYIDSVITLSCVCVVCFCGIYVGYIFCSVCVAYMGYILCINSVSAIHTWCL